MNTQSDAEGIHLLVKAKTHQTMQAKGMLISIHQTVKTTPLLAMNTKVGKKPPPKVNTKHMNSSNTKAKNLKHQDQCVCNAVNGQNKNVTSNH